MRDIEDLLQQTTPGDVRPPDLDALHRRGMRRRRAVRLGSAGTVAAVAAVGALTLQTIATPIVDGDGDGPAAGRDGGGAPTEADHPTYQEAAVQDCMEEAGLRYDVEPGTEPPPAAPTVTPSFVTEQLHKGVTQHEVFVEAAEERGWLGYRQALNEAPSNVPLAQEWYGAPQEHLWQEWEQEAIERGDAIDSDRDASVTEAERDAYVQQLTECQEEAYGIDILDLEQRRLLEQVATTDLTAAKATGFLAQDERVQAAQDQRVNCHQRYDDVLGEELSERLDRLAEQAGHEPPTESDHALDAARGRGEQHLLDADPADVPGLEDVIEDTREPTLQLLECERRYAEVVAEVAEERAGEYLASRTQDLRDAGIDVDLERD